MGSRDRRCNENLPAHGGYSLPASVNSENVMDEVNFALRKKNTVIPVIYRDCDVPFRLDRLQHVDFRQDYACGLRALLKILAPGQSARRRRPAIPNVGRQGQFVVYGADSLENILANIAREVDGKISDTLGGVTDTAIVLAKAIFHEGATAVAAGANPMALKRGIERAVRAICGYDETGKDGTKKHVKGKIDLISKPIRGEMIAQVGTVYANNDDTIGDIIAEAFKKTGRDGHVTVEESTNIETTREVVEGMQFEGGYLSPSFLTVPKRKECVLEDALILIHEKKIRSVKDLQALFEQTATTGKPLLIIAEEVGADALLPGTLLGCAVKAPSSGDRCKAILQDIAILTGGRVITDDLGIK